MKSEHTGTHPVLLYATNFTSCVSNKLKNRNVNMISEDNGTTAGSTPNDEGSDNKRRRGSSNSPRKNTTSKPPSKNKFEGDCDELKGHIYDCSDAQKAIRFETTNIKLAEYVGNKFQDFPGDMQFVIKNLEMPKFTMPVDPPVGASETEKRIWEKKCDSYAKREEALEQNMQRLYTLVMGQCTEYMRSVLHRLPSFQEIDETLDGLRLLKVMKGLVDIPHHQKHLPHAIHESLQRFYSLRQGVNVTVEAYHQQFLSMVDVVDTTTGGSMGHHKEILNAVAREESVDMDHATATQMETWTATAKERYLSVAFILGADRSRFGRYITDLERSFVQGQNKYPKTMTAAYDLLVHQWKPEPCHKMPSHGRMYTGDFFANAGTTTASNNNNNSNSVDWLDGGNGDKWAVKPTVGMKRAGRSAAAIWEYFTNDPSPQTSKSAVCKHCHNLFNHHKKSEQAKTHLLKCQPFCAAMSQLDVDQRPEWYIHGTSRSKRTGGTAQASVRAYCERRHSSHFSPSEFF